MVVCNPALLALIILVIFLMGDGHFRLVHSSIWPMKVPTHRHQLLHQMEGGETPNTYHEEQSEELLEVDDLPIRTSPHCYY